MCYMTHSDWWALCPNLKSQALMVWDLLCFEDLERKHYLISEGGVFRTALATPGLLMTEQLWSNST